MAERRCLGKKDLSAFIFVETVQIQFFDRQVELSDVFPHTLTATVS